MRWRRRRLRVQKTSVARRTVKGDYGISTVAKNLSPNALNEAKLKVEHLERRWRALNIY